MQKEESAKGSYLSKCSWCCTSKLIKRPPGEPKEEMPIGLVR